MGGHGTAITHNVASVTVDQEANSYELIPHILGQ